jgi:hypothetical protein
LVDHSALVARFASALAQGTLRGDRRQALIPQIDRTGNPLA